MKTENDNYESYIYDKISHGISLNIDHTVICKKDCDISDLIKNSAQTVESMREKSIENENAAYAKVLQAVTEWEKAAIVTQRHKMALEYLNEPPVEHTANKWVDAEYNYKRRSNMVYIMDYKIDKRMSRNNTIKWDLILSVRTQRAHNQSAVIIEYREKTFSSEESAQKYVTRKIKEYDNLFTEICPVIPDIEKYPFCINGELLPGYTTVSMQKELDEKAAQKPSVKGQINELKNQSKEKSKSESAKKRKEIEIE